MSDKQNKRLTRRTFIQRTGQGTAALAALSKAPAVFAAGYSPNETIGVGHIGAGVRGGQLLTETAGEPEKDRPGIANTKVLAISEIYKGHMEKGVKLSANPNCKSYHNYEDLLADKDIDVVIIAAARSLAFPNGNRCGKCRQRHLCRKMLDSHGPRSQSDAKGSEI